MDILFYDPTTPLAYDATTPLTQGLGGTEATVIRIAEGLKHYHRVFVAQHCRSTSLQAGVHYLTFEAAHQLSPDVVILLRRYNMLEEVAIRFPKARRYLWLHNMPSPALYQAGEILLKYHYQILAVSHFHRKAIEKRLHGKWFQKHKQIPVQVLYNPIDDLLQPDSTPVQAEQLLFMSSPQKGLAETLRLFKAVQHYFPEYHLLIANPGYSTMEITLPQQTRFLGALPRDQIIQELRRSFCVFYPQAVRVETFGLVYAEANAVGTPVLAHDMGAAREVLSDPQQLINGRKLSAVLEKLKAWRKKRPLLVGRSEFRLSEVIQKWLQLLSG